MKKQRMPTGWTQMQIRELALYHDNLTEDELVAEIEGADKPSDMTMDPVSIELVPQVLELIRRWKRSA